MAELIITRVVCSQELEKCVRKRKTQLVEMEKTLGEVKSGNLPKGTSERYGLHRRSNIGFSKRNGAGGGRGVWHASGRFEQEVNNIVAAFGSSSIASGDALFVGLFALHQL